MDIINTVVTSKQAILDCCKALVAQNGIKAINMRSVAKECNVALGSLYNYYPSKEELTAAVIESVWHDIFHNARRKKSINSFPEYIEWLFESVKEGAVEYHDFFIAHSLGFAGGRKPKARKTMDNYFIHMKNAMAKMLGDDKNIKDNAFSDDFTKTDFIDFVLSSLLSLLIEQKESCLVLTEMIRRTIY